MRPPYDPAHIERVVFSDSRTTTVLARCSCGWEGPGHVLTPAGGVARDLAADLNAHRVSYLIAA